MDDIAIKKILKKNEKRGRKRKYIFSEMKRGEIRTFYQTYPQSLLTCAKHYLEAESAKGNVLNWEFNAWQDGTMTKIIRRK